MKKIICLFLSLILALTSLCLTSCDSADSNDAGPATKIGFSDAVSLETIKSLNGKTVKIMGYMATLSPVNGKYIYLMNMPYQSCPFCIPNSTQLSNTIAVYAKNGSTLEYTDQAVNITGRIEVGNYTDDYGYTYNYRIVDATCANVDVSELSDEIKLWYSLASDGIIANVNAMFDQVYFACQWTEFAVNDNDGKIAYYLYPSDLHKAEGNGYLDAGGFYADAISNSYYDSLISRVRGISSELEDLVGIIEKARELAMKGYDELLAENYSAVATDKSPEGQKYVLTNGEALSGEFDNLYAAFSHWLSKWEM